MKRWFSVFMILGALLSSQRLPAQIAKSDVYKTGTFPNGVKYCMVSNNYVKGLVDIALIQQQPGDVRALLDTLDEMNGRSPARYFSDRGVAYSKNGYAFKEGNATVWQFSDVPVGVTMDSTLFILSKIIKSSPVTSTLIMCGDINTSSMVDRMGIFMMHVPDREPEQGESEYIWHSMADRTVRYVCNGKENSAVVIIKFNLPRIPDEARLTIRPFLSKFFARCLTSLLRERMSNEFKQRNIAFSELNSIYLDSASTSGDESFTITFRVLMNELDSAVSCAASVMSGIDKFGVTPEEFQRVNYGLVDFLAEKIKTGNLSNEYYVKNCLNAYLNGANLASIPEIKKYVEGRQFGAAQITPFFNGFASALLDKANNANFTFLCPTDPGVDNVMGSFDEGWNHPVSATMAELPVYEDVFHRVAAPMSVRRDMKDNISGGKLWKFSNGMRVIFKRTTGGGDVMDYYFIIRGGVQNISNPAPGETAFVQDMFNLCGVGGMKHSEFDMVLASRGISVRSFANNNGLMLRGKIPSSRLKELPMVLASLKNLNLPYQSDIEYYRKCIQTGDENPRILLNYRIDQLLRPDDKQLEYKFSGNLTDSTAIKALEYYKDRFSRMNDGILLIFGDMDPDFAMMTIMRNIGVLSVKHKNEKVQWRECPQICSGTNVIIDTASILNLNSAKIKIKLAEDVSRENNIKFNLAALCIKETLGKILFDHGFTVSSDIGYSLYPEGTFSACFDIVPCNGYGLPLHVGSPSSILDVMADIHTRLNSGDDVDTGNLGLYKTILTSTLETELTDERKLIAYSLLRYVAGKAVTEDYKSQISSVNEKQVREMAEKILNAGRVEYIVR